MSKPNIRKRTLQEERKVFNEEWELQFYEVAVKDKMMCLLCNFMITTAKKYNANQHYTTHKNHKYVALESEARKDSLNKMKLIISNSGKCFSQYQGKRQTLLKQLIE